MYKWTWGNIDTVGCVFCGIEYCVIISFKIPTEKIARYSGATRGGREGAIPQPLYTGFSFTFVRLFVISIPPDATRTNRPVWCAAVDACRVPIPRTRCLLFDDYVSYVRTVIRLSSLYILILYHCYQHDSEWAHVHSSAVINDIIVNCYPFIVCGWK